MTQPTAEQIEAFNILRQRNIFSPQQTEIIKLLEGRGELVDNIIPIMSRMKLSTNALHDTPEEDQVKFDASNAQYDPNYQYADTSTGGFINTMQESIKPADISMPMMQMLSQQIIRPGLQTVGAIGGGIIGSGASPVAGTIAGGALGFAIGDDLADILDTFMGLRQPQPLTVELMEAGQNLVIGATYEIGGQALSQGLSMGTQAFVKSKAGQQLIQNLSKIKNKMPPLRAKTIKGMAGKILAADIGEGRTLVAQNMDEAKLLEELIPGLKFQYGQITDDAMAISFEKALEKEVPNFAAQQAQRQSANIKAIGDFLETYKGNANIGDVRKIMQAEQELINTGIMSARKTLETEAKAFGEMSGELEAGGTLRSLLESEYKTAKKVSGELFESIPTTEIAPTEPIIKKLQEVAKPYDRADLVSETFPKRLVSMYEDFMAAAGKEVPETLPQGLKGARTLPKEKAMSYTDLNSYRKHLSKLLDKMKSAHPSHRNKLAEKRIAEVIGVVEDTITKGASKDKYTAKAIKKARTLHKETVYEPFETGRVKDIMADKISDAKVASEFFVAGPEGVTAAKQFNAALGNNETAKTALNSAIKQNLIEEATDPITKQVDPKKLIKWLSKHRYALKELNMLDDFSTAAKASRQIIDALDAEKAFNKSIASDIIKSDVGSEIRDILASKFRGQKTIELMRKVGGNKKAVQGVQNAFIEEIQSVPLESAEAINAFMKKNRPAYDAAFADNKTKLQALDTYQKAINKIFPGSKPITGDIDKFIEALNTITKAPAKERGLIGSVLNGIKEGLKSRSRRQIQALMTKASLDPDFAFSLIYSIRNKQPSAALDLINRTLRVYGMSETANNEE